MSDRPDGVVVLPGVPWQELARRYEGALRHLSWLTSADIEDGQRWDRFCETIDRALAAPAPSATTAEAATAEAANAVSVVLRPGETVFVRSERDEWCRACGKHVSAHYGGTEYRCHPRDDQPAPPSSAGEATAPSVQEWIRRACDAENELPQLRTQLAAARAEVERLTRERDGMWGRVQFLETCVEERRKQKDAAEAERDAATKRAESSERDRRVMEEVLAETKRELERERKAADEAEAACAAMREALNHCVEALKNHEVFPCGHSGDGDGPECFHDCGRCAAEEALAHAEEASTSNTGASLLRERDELRDLFREALDEGYIVCDGNTDDDGNTVCIGGMCMRERMRAALTPPAPSDSDGEKGGGK